MSDGYSTEIDLDAKPHVRENFISFGQPADCPQNYKTLLWIFVASLLANSVPDTILTGFMNMLPPGIGKMQRPVSLGIVTVLVFALAQFLI
jgi:hypothetical protein